MGDYWELRNVQAGMVNVLKNVDGAASWCSKTGASDPEACTGVLGNSLDAAMADLKTCFGKDPHAWHWGDAHQARSEHQPFAKVELLAPIFDISIASPGDTYTVDVGRYNLRDKDKLFTNPEHARAVRPVEPGEFALHAFDRPIGQRAVFALCRLQPALGQRRLSAHGNAARNGRKRQDGHADPGAVSGRDAHGLGRKQILTSFT